MKTITFIISLLFALNGIAQNYNLNNDSLRVHFRKEKPYQVYDYCMRNSIYNIDFKSLYYDNELKQYLLQWLDINQYIDYAVENYKKDILPLIEKNKPISASETYTREAILICAKDYIKNICNLNYDSIRNNAMLYNQYLYKTIQWLVDNKKKSLLENKDSVRLPYDATLFLARIKYPEAYTIIKSSKCAKYSLELLHMNDPDEITKMNNIINEFVRTNGENSKLDIYNILVTINFLETAYAIDKMIELTKVTKEFEFIATTDGSGYEPCNYFILQQLIPFYGISNIDKIDMLNMPQKKFMEYADIIINAAKKRAEKLREEEKYWMENMPFTK